MGLDMYLEGRKYLGFGQDCPEEDGFPLREKVLELGYWRKHPNLHGYIVQTFAKGVDDCRPIKLGLDELEQIAEAVREGRLPHTDGFFFGASTGEEDEETLAILDHAMAWIREGRTEREMRLCQYRASW